MEEAISIIQKHCEKSGIPVNSDEDPNGTGLIGPRRSDLTTTLGHPGAKRTTTNPNMAGLIVRLLSEAGVNKGDRVAISSSASFPALMIASLCAVQAMEADPTVILSLGSSSYGAGNIQFNLLDMYMLLAEKGIFTVKPAAVSLGGEHDTGRDFNRETRQILVRQILKRTVPFIHEPDLRKNIRTRMRFYQNGKESGKIAAFINCGGSYSSLGSHSLILNVKPGLNRALPLPPEEERGMLFEMSSMGIPCIHLLHIRGLAQKYGLPWDPIPLPRAGAVAQVAGGGRHGTAFYSVVAVYFLVLFAIVFYSKRRNRSRA
jgi:poly-gamma-glutamate system protein